MPRERNTGTAPTADIAPRHAGPEQPYEKRGRAAADCGSGQTARSANAKVMAGLPNETCRIGRTLVLSVAAGAASAYVMLAIRRIRHSGGVLP